MNQQTPKPRSNLTESFIGAWEVMLGRETGMQRIDFSNAGFWISFWGLGLSLLIDASSYSIFYSSPELKVDPNSVSKLQFLSKAAFISLISYVFYMLTLYLLCRRPGEKKRYVYAVIVSNWAMPLMSLIVFLEGMLTAIPVFYESAPELRTYIYVMIIVAFIYLELNILRVSLKIDSVRAFVFLFVMFCVSYGCTSVLGNMTGMTS